MSESTKGPQAPEPTLRAVRVWDSATRRWTTLGEGDFPVTASALRQARARFAARYAELLDRDPLSQAPQTVAREVIGAVVPGLAGLDVLLLGYLVTNPYIEVDGTRWPDDPALEALAARCTSCDQGTPRRPPRLRAKASARVASDEETRGEKTWRAP